MIRRAFLLPLVLAALVVPLASCSSQVAQAGWCAYHVVRFAADIHHHSRGWAAFQALLAVHHCGRV